MGLHAEEDEVSCGTSQAALQVGAAPNLLSVRIKTIEGLHGLLKELPLNLEEEREADCQPPRGWAEIRAWEMVKYWHTGMTEGLQAEQRPLGTGDLESSPDWSMN